MTQVISVIIATWRREHALIALLKDLKKQKEVHGEVIVIDQNEGNPFSMHDFDQQNESGLLLRVIVAEVGGVAARNRGASQARGDILVFLDDDVRIDDCYFLKAHQLAYQEPDVDAVCGQELPPPVFETYECIENYSTPFEECMLYHRNSIHSARVCVWSTCNASIRKTVWIELGGLDESFKGNSYGDDMDLALRLNARGGKIRYLPSASVRHLMDSRGGLRLTDPTNSRRETDKYLSMWVFYLRHVPENWRWWYLWKGILRRSLFLKYNFYRPYRWPSILSGLISSWWMARRQAGMIFK